MTSALLDARYSIHGSTNGNFRSLEDDKDLELVVLVDDEAFAKHVLEIVRDLDVRPLTQGDAARRGQQHGRLYIGLTPGENSSSMRVQRTAIAKAEASDLRAALIQGAWSAMRSQGSEPMIQWAMALAQRRNRFVAVTALARKLRVPWAVWTRGTTYQSNLSAAPSADSKLDVM